MATPSSHNETADVNIINSNTVMNKTYMYSSFDDFVHFTPWRDVTPAPAMLRHGSSTASTLSSISTGTMISIAVAETVYRSSPIQSRRSLMSCAHGDSQSVLTSWEDYASPAFMIPKSPPPKRKSAPAFTSMAMSQLNTLPSLEYQTSDDDFLQKMSTSYRNSCIGLDAGTSNTSPWDDALSESVRHFEVEQELLDGSTLDDALAILSSDETISTDLSSASSSRNLTPHKFPRAQSRRNAFKMTGRYPNDMSFSQRASSGSSAKSAKKPFSALAQCRKNKRDLLMGKSVDSEDARRRSHPSRANHKDSQRMRPDQVQHWPSTKGLCALAFDDSPGKKSKSLSMEKHVEVFEKTRQFLRKDQMPPSDDLPSLSSYSDHSTGTSGKTEDVTGAEEKSLSLTSYSHHSHNETDDASDTNAEDALEKFMNDVSSITNDTSLRRLRFHYSSSLDEEDTDSDDEVEAFPNVAEPTLEEKISSGSDFLLHLDLEDATTEEQQQAIMDSFSGSFSIPPELSEQPKMHRPRRRSNNYEEPEGDDNFKPDARASWSYPNMYSGEGCSALKRKSCPPPASSSLLALAIPKGGPELKVGYGLLQSELQGSHHSALSRRSSASRRSSDRSGSGREVYGGGISLDLSSHSYRREDPENSAALMECNMGKVLRLFKRPYCNSSPKTPSMGDRVMLLSNGERVLVRGLLHLYRDIIVGSTSLCICSECQEILQVPGSTTAAFCPDCQEVSEFTEANLLDVANALETDSLDKANTILDSCLAQQQRDARDVVKQMEMSAMEESRRAFEAASNLDKYG